MNRILVIDDLRVFNLLPGPVVYARTSLAALELLSLAHWEGSPWDEVWWDHDLGGDDTTIPVLNWLEEHHFHANTVGIKRCFVHSSNPVGANTLAVGLSRMYPTTRVDSALYSTSVIE